MRVEIQRILSGGIEAIQDLHFICLFFQYELSLLVWVCKCALFVSEI
jgi:hypothetical protein